MDREETACITGHRAKGLPWGYDETKESCKKFKVDIKQIFTGAIEYGFSTFLIGMAEGFDMIAAEILIELRKVYKHIKIFAVIPCKNQDRKWSLSQRLRYKRILWHCDERIILSDFYTPTCMNDRNKYMVKHSSVCIACWSGRSSGTGNTVRFAKENGCKIKIVNPEDYV